MPLLDRHIAFIEALRSAGLPVSLSEDLDSVEVLTRLGFTDREAMRAGLAATLMKRQNHRPTFDAIFDLLEESGATLHSQADALEAAGRALEEAAQLMKTQAELFERTVATLRKPGELAKSAAGLERHPQTGQPESRG